MDLTASAAADLNQDGKTDLVVANNNFQQPSTISVLLGKGDGTFKPTVNYPEKTRPFSPVFRGLHVLNRDEQGRERCTACGLCAVACPAEAITMEGAERLPGEENLYREEKYAAKY